MTNLIVTLTNTETNKQVRIQAARIVGYEKKYLSTLQEEVTVVYVDHEELSAIFVKQSPEQLDKLMCDCYVTVKGEV